MKPDLMLDALYLLRRDGEAELPVGQANVDELREWLDKQGVATSAEHVRPGTHRLRRVEK